MVFTDEYGIRLGCIPDAGTVTLAFSLTPTLSIAETLGYLSLCGMERASILAVVETVEFKFRKSILASRLTFAKILHRQRWHDRLCGQL